MGSGYDEIKDSIKKIALNGETLHSLLGFVDKVDEESLTCTVTSADRLSVFDNVRLKEITTVGSGGFWLLPAIDSRVIIDFIGAGQPYITMVSEIDKLYVVIENFALTLSASGLSIENKKESKDLKKTIDNLLDFLATEYKVQTAWGPSGPAMTDAADKLNEFKNDFATILVEGKDNAPS